MTNGIYDFEPDSYATLKSSRYEDLPNTSSKQSFTHAQAALLDLIKGTQKDKLSKRGYVFVVNGPWGAGKTTGTWAMINSLRESLAVNNPSGELLVIDRSFLPFGSVSESVTSFLKELAQELWAGGLVDVRAEMEQFILEATPATLDYTASLAMGPLNISRPIKVISKDITHDVMVERFQRLASKHTTVVLIIDDLDRLRPAEIVQVMRLVEKLRTLPNVIIILPVYKQIIAEAFHSDLQIPLPAASTFMRKLTDMDVRIENNLPDVSSAFCHLFTSETKQVFDPLLQNYGITVEALCWFMLMHNIIIAEATAKAPDMDSPAKLFSNSQSEYLRILQRDFFDHMRITSIAPRIIQAFPAHFVNDGGKEVFAPLGQHYQEIANNPGNDTALQQLSEMRRVENVMKLITRNDSLNNELHTRSDIDFDPSLQQASSAPAIMEVFAPILRNLSIEPLITDHYKLRDVRILARKIQGHSSFQGDQTSLVGNLYFAVKDSFDSFRF